MKFNLYNINNNQNNKRTINTKISTPHFGYHQVDPSPWPAQTRFCLQFLTTSLVLCFHKYTGGATLFIFAICSLIIVASLWWRDVIRENIGGAHTSKVKNGQYLGMILFIWSERMFFVGLQWRTLHARLMPTVQIGQCWPPLGVVPVEWTGLPKTNTQLLLRSYFTANAAKHRIDTNNHKQCKAILGLTILLGLLFVYCQYLEYTHRPFTFSDSIYGSTFFLTTGFHGFHVVVGFQYQRVCYFTLNSRSSGKSVATDQAIQYWHFVDIVWVFLLVIVYVWGSAIPSAEISACTDDFCTFIVVLQDAQTFAATHDPTLYEALVAYSKF